MEEFKVGDVVRLRSGSPKMTVEISSKPKLVCAWFDKDGDYKRVELYPETIEKVS